ncbi:MAG: hypothetical protein ABID04_04105 [Patescibacteria group bacterium]
MENLLNNNTDVGFDQPVENQKVVPPTEVSSKPKINLEPKLLLGFLGLLVFGLFSGWLLSRLPFVGGKTGEISTEKQSASRLAAGLEKGEQLESGTTYGQDSEAFKDSAQGVIAKNEVGNEGSHLLLREGGDSQTVYLTSSVLDLDLFLDRKVEIWGETFSAQKAGWLMDVGKVKVLE